jgi:uncharacterized iron-regulated membrane protein
VQKRAWSKSSVENLKVTLAKGALMRKLHRWLAPILGLFLLIIAATGLVIQATDLLDSAPAKDGTRIAGPNAAIAPSAQTPPPQLEAKRPPRSPMKQWNGFFKHIHSGEYFGPFGIVINIIAGIALLFFAASGMWMYWSMFRRRKNAGQNAIFWR